MLDLSRWVTLLDWICQEKDYNLSGREADILRAKFPEPNKIKTDKQVAENESIHLQPDSVRKHIKAVFDKLKPTEQRPEGFPNYDNRKNYETEKAFQEWVISQLNNKAFQNWLKDRDFTTKNCQDSSAKADIYLKPEPPKKPFSESPSIEELCSSEFDQIITTIIYPKTEKILRFRTQPLSLKEWITFLIAYLKSFTKTAEFLQISESTLQALIGGYAGELPEFKLGSVGSIKAKVNHFINQTFFVIPIDIFKIAPHDLLIKTVDPNFKNLYLSISESYFVEQEFRNFVDREIQQNCQAFENRKLKNRLRKEYLPKLYRQVGIHVPPSRFEAFARNSFERQAWDSIIHKSQVDNGYYENHLHYTNAWIADTITYHLKILLKRQRYRQNLKGYLRILEGGVGGANTTQMLLRNLKHLWEKEEYDKTIQALKVQYLGYDINPTFVARTQDFFQGTTTSDSRSRFFKSLHLEPWDRQDALVIAQDMVKGIQELEQCESYHKSVHIFICSYAFHHVPNGTDFKHYLFAQPNRVQDRVDSFIEEVKKILEADFNYDPQLQFLESRVFTEYVRNPSQQDINALCKNLRGLLTKPATEELTFQFVDEFLIDPKLETLRKIRNLLVPGGILVIADPDGLSNFNAEKIIVDPEMVVAHFLAVNKMTELLKQSRFENIKTCVVGRTKDTREDYRFNTVDKPGDPDFQDDNLGYIIFAQRPFD